MKYADFKVHLKGVMHGDKSVPEDETLKPIILEVLKEVAMKCEPIILFSENHELFDVLKYMEDEEYLFIRVPNLPTSDDDEIDIDDILVYAVSYLTAYTISSKYDKYEKKAKKIINDYQWKRYEDIQSGKINLYKSIARHLLDMYGLKDIYTHKIKTIYGFKYVWDKRFITVLGRYLNGEALHLSKSDRHNIDKYLEYQSKGLGDNELYEALDKHLGSIRDARRK